MIGAIVGGILVSVYFDCLVDRYHVGSIEEPPVTRSDKVLFTSLVSVCLTLTALLANF